MSASSSSTPASLSSVSLDSPPGSPELIRSSNKTGSTSSSPRMRNPAQTGNLSGRKVQEEENLFEEEIISSSSIVTFLAIGVIGALLTVLAVHGIGTPYTNIGAYAIWSVEGLSILAVLTAFIVKACGRRNHKTAPVSEPNSPLSGSRSPIESPSQRRGSALLRSVSEDEEIERLLRTAPNPPPSEPTHRENRFEVLSTPPSTSGSPEAVPALTIDSESDYSHLPSLPSTPPDSSDEEDGSSSGSPVSESAAIRRLSSSPSATDTIEADDVVLNDYSSEAPAPDSTESPASTHEQRYVLD